MKATIKELLWETTLTKADFHMNLEELQDSLGVHSQCFELYMRERLGVYGHDVIPAEVPTDKKYRLDMVNM